MIDRTKVDYKNKDTIVHTRNPDPKKWIEATERYGPLVIGNYVTRDY